MTYAELWCQIVWEHFRQPCVEFQPWRRQLGNMFMTTPWLFLKWVSIFLSRFFGCFCPGMCFCPGVCFCPNIGTRKNNSSLVKCIFLSSAVFELYTRVSTWASRFCELCSLRFCHSSSGWMLLSQGGWKTLKYFLSALQNSYRTDVIFVYKFT